MILLFSHVLFSAIFCCVLSSKEQCIPNVTYLFLHAMFAQNIF